MKYRKYLVIILMMVIVFGLGCVDNTPSKPGRDNETVPMSPVTTTMVPVQTIVQETKSQNVVTTPIVTQNIDISIITPTVTPISTQTSTPIPTQTSISTSCDPSYPDFCIPPSPPDLDCGDISRKNFKVLSPDPHKFDRDGDGIGCET